MRFGTRWDRKFNEPEEQGTLARSPTYTQRLEVVGEAAYCPLVQYGDWKGGKQGDPYSVIGGTGRVEYWKVGTGRE